MEREDDGWDGAAAGLTQPIDELWDPDAEAIEVPISALCQWGYCPRRCALIHVEQTFDENLYTIRGRLAHARVHAAGADWLAVAGIASEADLAPGVRVVRGMRLWSERLGLTGQADVVELRANGPYPVEYKLGGRRGGYADLQLCAQALCLEEMLGQAVPLGAVYSHTRRRREEVALTTELRAQTEAVVAAVRAILREQRLPAAPNDARCRHCSLVDSCLPGVVGTPARVRGLQGALFRVEPLVIEAAEPKHVPAGGPPGAGSPGEPGWRADLDTEPWAEADDGDE